MVRSEFKKNFTLNHIRLPNGWRYECENAPANFYIKNVERDKQMVFLHENGKKAFTICDELNYLFIDDGKRLKYHILDDQLLKIATLFTFLMKFNEILTD